MDKTRLAKWHYSKVYELSHKLLKFTIDNIVAVHRHDDHEKRADLILRIHKAKYEMEKLKNEKKLTADKIEMFLDLSLKLSDKLAYRIKEPRLEAINHLRMAKSLKMEKPKPKPDNKRKYKAPKIRMY